MNDPYMLYIVDVNEVNMSGWMDREEIMIGRVGRRDRQTDRCIDRQMIRHNRIDRKWIYTV